MTYVLRSVLIALFLSFSSLLQAADFGNAKVEFVLPHVNDQVFFKLKGVKAANINARGLNGGCVTTNTGTFRVNLRDDSKTGRDNETGPAIYAALLMALAQDRTIQVSTSNACTGPRENVNWVKVY